MITLLKLMPYTGAIMAPSPNRGMRRALSIEGIVLHATADQGNEAATLAWMRSPKSRVSCHLFVSRSGDVTRLVGDHQRAWHAGKASWRGTTDVNSITLGIEIANRNDGEGYTDAQYGRVAEIVAHYCRQGLTIDDVVGHEAIAQDRRTDPFGWNWVRFRAMVLEQLHSSDFEDRWLTYDRRSTERRLADEAASDGSAMMQKTTASQKSALCSRTIWLNGMTVLAAGAVIVGETLELAFSVGLTVPEEITMWALFGVGMVNIILRLQTNCPIGSGKSAQLR